MENKSIIQLNEQPQSLTAKLFADKVFSFIIYKKDCCHNFSMQVPEALENLSFYLKESNQEIVENFLGYLLKRSRSAQILRRRKIRHPLIRKLGIEPKKLDKSESPFLALSLKS